TRQQWSDRSPDGDATSDHHHMLTCPVETVACYKFDHSARRARQRRSDFGVGVPHETAEIRRVQPISIFRGVDALENAVGVYVRGQRQLHDVAGTRRISVQLVEYGLKFCLRDTRR